uniref:Growth hormone-releasing hormone/pituitary adenylate cyclase activating polypeptide n=1 Tax=Epinephelus coioides TaxID=94232 RepID=Q4VK75_EPICO|nr:growth hormone-releasing hormone/pituitary adenylate cyclase activating polypeptide precursor [Epinephelus coioides]AMR58951.1 PRP-PACAPb [Epinephelus coioides]
MASSSKATLILLVYGILMHYSVFCTPIGLSYPKIRLENDAFDEDGNALSDMGFDSDQIAIRSPPSLNDDAYTLYYPPEKRPERHAEEELDRALREILGQLTARHYLHSLMTIRAGEDNSMEEESEPLSKRHSDGIFTDSYSRYRKQMRNTWQRFWEEGTDRELGTKDAGLPICSVVTAPLNCPPVYIHPVVKSKSFRYI